MSNKILNIHYSDVLNKFNIYKDYKDELLKLSQNIAIEKFKIKEEELKKDLKKDFLFQLKNCFNLANITEEYLVSKEINGSELHYDDELGEPLLHIKKLNVKRWIFFIIMTFLLFIFYISIISIPIGIIRDIMVFDDIWKMIKNATIGIIIFPIFYVMILIIITKLSNNINIESFKDLKKFIKDNLSLLLFPFNKLSTDKLGIHFIIGTKGLFIYSEFNTHGLHNGYRYKELLEDGYIDNNAFRKLLNTNCKKKIFELAKKYYS